MIVPLTSMSSMGHRATGLFFIAHGCKHQGPDVFTEVNGEDLRAGGLLKWGVPLVIIHFNNRIFHCNGWKMMFFIWIFPFKPPFVDDLSITGWWFGTMQFYHFPIILGMSYSHLTFTPSFFRGVG